MNDSQRIKAVVDYLKTEKIIRNQRDFAERINDNYSVVSEIMSGRRNVSERFISKITEAFPCVSREWILHETGDMIIEVKAPESNNEEIRVLIHTNFSLADSVAKLADTNSRLADKILELTSITIKKDVVQADDDVGCVGAK